jgi:hypothetical protein
MSRKITPVDVKGEILMASALTGAQLRNIAEVTAPATIGAKHLLSICYTLVIQECA